MLNAEADNGQEIHGTRVLEQQLDSQIPGKEDTNREDNWIFVSWFLTPDISVIGEENNLWRFQSLAELKESTLIEVQTADPYPRQRREALTEIEFEIL